MTLFGVRTEKEKELTDRMTRLNISESDLIEKFLHSSGKGGQNVNKTSTLVYLKHIPTGIEVKCQRERVQAINRFVARRILCDKVEDRIMGRRREEISRIEKIRRQKRKRSKRAKEKMLRQKHMQSEKKEMRKPINSI